MHDIAHGQTHKLYRQRCSISLAQRALKLAIMTFQEFAAIMASIAKQSSVQNPIDANLSFPRRCVQAHDDGIGDDGCEAMNLTIMLKLKERLLIHWERSE
jgi:hypothetical protein